MISRPYLRTPRSKIIQAARDVSAKRHEFLSAVAKGLIPADCSPSLKKKSKIFTVEVDVRYHLQCYNSINKSSQRVQTSPCAKISTESDLGFESGFSD